MHVDPGVSSYKKAFFPLEVSGPRCVTASVFRSKAALSLVYVRRSCAIQELTKSGGTAFLLALAFSPFGSVKKRPGNSRRKRFPKDISPRKMPPLPLSSVSPLATCSKPFLLCRCTNGLLGFFSFMMCWAFFRLLGQRSWKLVDPE